MTTRIGVDIGGTFTDGVAYDAASSQVHIEKVLTTSGELSDGFLAVFDTLAVRMGVSPADVAEVMHASTVATNALLERKGARVGLLVTAGFRDVLEIGRQVRSDLYDLFTTKPEPLVPRARVYEVRGRLDHRGDIKTPLELDDVRAAVAAMSADDIDSIAICFLHSYRNPVHERDAAAVVRELLPTVSLSVSSEIAPEIKEYWRASTTCVNAYVGPVVRRYLDRIDARLTDRGFAGSVGIMHSGGGIEHVRSVAERPFQMIESGPAAGVAAAAHFARSLGYANGLSFDMGGTTAKAGLILDGVSRVLPEFEVAAHEGSGASVAKASGYPILGEVVDLVEVGAGGGSLAWIDEGGHLRVGPQGAGSDPGPACYGLGGDRPTITDANLVLGRLDPAFFLGGQMALDREAAERAILTVCAGPLGTTAVEAAHGIVAIANARMMGALRLVSVERGHDPREFCLVAFGGAGPLHAAALATELGIPDVLIPPNPGVASAWGLLLSDVKHDARRTVLRPLAAGEFDGLRDVFALLTERVRADLEREDVATSRFTLSPYVEARYLGQSSRLRIDWVDDADEERAVATMTARFHGEHEREFGYHVDGEPIQVLTAGVTATARRIASDELPAHRGPSGRATPKGERDVAFEGAQPSRVPVYDRSALPTGVSLDGPALIEEFDATTLVPHGFSFQVEEFGVLHLRRAG